MTSTTPSDASRASDRPKLALLGAAGALDLASHLRRASADLLDAEPAPDAASVELAMRHGYQRLSARTGDVGNLRAVLQILRVAKTGKLPENWIWRDAEGRVFDGLRPEVDPDGVADIDELVFLREAHQKALMAVLADAEVLILMLSGEGCLVDAQDGAAYPPQTGTAARPKRGVELAQHPGDLQRLNDDFEALYNLLSEINPRLSLHVALVPLPVQAGQDGGDFATRLPLLRQQSDLRVLMAHWAATRPRVTYLPLWELCTGPLAHAGQFSAASGQLTPEGGLRAAALCLGHEIPFDGAAPPAVTLSEHATDALAKKRARRAQRRADRAAHGAADSSSVICEEELLEAFSK